MGKFRIEVTNSANKDFAKIYKSGKKSDILKVETFLKEIEINPREGSGKPEQLKYYKGEIWSRRINKKDRLVYEIFDDKILVLIIQSIGHYDDK